jgi:phage/plasmid-associated DNA primase
MDYVSYHSSDYINLENTIKNYISDKNTKSNFIDQADNEIYYRKGYNIPDERMNQIFEHLKHMCVENNGFYCFSERQKDDENGIFIDIDSYNNDNKRKYTDRDLKNVLNDYMDILVENMEELNKNEEIKIHAFIMERNEMTYDDKKNQYKEGYHILIPDLYLNKVSRKYILQELKKENNDIDTATASNPSMLYGNVKPKHLKTRDKYIIKMQKEINIYNKRTRVAFDIDDYILDTNKCNIIKELSLTYEGDILKSQKIRLKEGIIKDLQNIEIIELDDINKKDMNSLEELRKYDIDANYLCELLEILDSKYYDEREYWWRTLCGIYNTSLKSENKYDIIAEWFSKKSNKYDENEYIKQWNDIKQRSKDNATPITIGTIKHYARESNKGKYISIVENNDVEMIKNEINKNLDSLQHYTVAKILHNILGKYVYYASISESKCTWYTYLDNSKMKVYSEDGQLYKWVNEGMNPITLSLYISEELSKRIDKVIHEYEMQIEKMDAQNNKSKIDLENLRNKKKQVEKTRINFGNSGYKKSVLSECRNLFYSAYFIKNLDQEKRVLGVKNGILLLPLNKNESLVHINDYCNETYIESYTAVNYIEYDENNKHVKKLYKLLEDIIPEKDALEYILIFLSTSISNIAKEALILFFRGVGSNGKSTLLELMLNTLGCFYAKKLSLGLLTDSRESSQTSNSAFMELKSARFGYFSEPDKVEKINTGRLKEVLGNEKLTGRQLYGKQENFENKCNLTAASNYDFVIACNDHGIWRRIKYYEFKIKFVENPAKDNKYEKKLIKNLITNVIRDDEYLEAFLSILIHYYKKYIYEYDGDIKNVKSPTIEYETDQYRGRQDYMMRFVLEKVEIIESNDNNRMSLEEFAKHYNSWYVSMNGLTLKSSFDCKEIVPMIENSKLSTYIKIDPITYNKYFNNIYIKSIVDDL